MINNRVYDTVRKLTEVPLKERIEVNIKKGTGSKNVTPRRYHETVKSAERAKKAFAELQKQFPNIEAEKLIDEKFYIPFRPSGPYCGAVMALYLLGVNKFHELYLVKNKMQEFMSKIGINKKGISAWQRFDRKMERPMATKTQDVSGRIMDNMAVLQRLGGYNPCGNKLADIGCCIDIKYSSDGLAYYLLNTHFDINTMNPVIDRSECPKKKTRVRVINPEKEFAKKEKKLKKKMLTSNEELVKELLDRKSAQHKEETVPCKAEA